MVASREKFSSQAAPELLEAVREIARKEGRQFQVVLEDALRNYVESKEQQKPDPKSWLTSGRVWRETAASLNCSRNEPRVPYN